MSVVRSDYSEAARLKCHGMSRRILTVCVLSYTSIVAVSVSEF